MTGHRTIRTASAAEAARAAKAALRERLRVDRVGEKSLKMRSNFKVQISKSIRLIGVRNSHGRALPIYGNYAMDSLAPARSALAGLWLRPPFLSPVGSFTPVQSALRPSLSQILFATSQVAQIPSGSSLVW